MIPIVPIESKNKSKIVSYLSGMMLYSVVESIKYSKNSQETQAERERQKAKTTIA